MVGEVVVRDGNGSRAHYSINKAISTIGKRVVVNPNVARSKNGDGIAISHCPPPIMRWRAPNHGIASGLAIMDVETMDDDIGHKLDCNASPIGDVDIDTSCINCLKAIHEELLL